MAQARPTFSSKGLDGGKPLRMPFGEPLFAEQPEVFGLGPRRVAVGAEERAMLLLAHGIDGLGHLAHDVEPVEHEAPVAVR